MIHTNNIKNSCRFAYVSVPGLGNSGPGHWQTWMESVIGNVKRIRLSDWDTPSLGDWLNAIDAELMFERRSAILIAHSFGALAAAQYAIEESARIAGVLLVAPADPAKFSRSATLTMSHIPAPSVLVASQNDPWMEIHVAERWARIWGAKFISEGAAGHINAESGHGRWQGGLSHLSQLVYRARAYSAHPPGRILFNGHEIRRPLPPEGR